MCKHKIKKDSNRIKYTLVNGFIFLTGLKLQNKIDFPSTHADLRYMHQNVLMILKVN